MPIYTFPPGAAGGGGGSGVDTRAATFVVNPTGQNADFDNLPAAVAALAALSPVFGGKLFLREGVYNLPVVLPDCPITFEGVAAEAAFGPAAGTVIDLGANPVDMFSVLAGGVNSLKYKFIRCNFRGAGVIGQNVFRDDSACVPEFEDCDFQSLDKICVGNAANGTNLKLKGCTSFLVQQIFDALFDFVSVCDIRDSLLFIDGPVAVNGKTSFNVSNSNINTFALVNPTVECGFGSVINGCRLLLDITIPAGVFDCRFGTFSMLGKLTIDGAFNDIGAGSNVESVPLGIVLAGARNSLVGLHFDGVATPIQETTGDFNLVDGVNGFGASVFPVGANSVLGTVVP